MIDRSRGVSGIDKLRILHFHATETYEQISLLGISTFASEMAAFDCVDLSRPHLKLHPISAEKTTSPLEVPLNCLKWCF